MNGDAAATARAGRVSAYPPWWTDADQAELDVLTDKFVGGYFQHRQRCSVCGKSGPWCEGLRKAFDVVLDFRRGRLLLSRARLLRAGEDLAEFAENLGV